MGVELPRNGTLRGVELSGGWNSQRMELPLVPGGKTRRKVELSREWNSQQSKIQVAGHFLHFLNSKIHTQIYIKISIRGLGSKFT